MYRFYAFIETANALLGLYFNFAFYIIKLIAYIFRMKNVVRIFVRFATILTRGEEMDILSSLSNAVDYIERNLCDEIDISQIARASALNEYELNNLFHSLTGMTIKEYIRKRRLTLAAFDLQSSEQRIIDVAIKYGYDSADSFRRAFVSQHNILPSAVKTKSAALNIYPPLSFEIKVKGANKMNFKIVNLEELVVYGISTPCFSADSERYELARDVWDEKYQHIPQKICDGYDGVWYGIWSNNSYTIARDKSNCTKENLIKTVIPSGQYAVFTTECGGYAGDELPKLHSQIFDCWLPDSGYEISRDFELEVYHLATDRAKRRKERYYEIWIPVTEKKKVLNDRNFKIRSAKLSDAKMLAEICRNDLGYDCTDFLVKQKLELIDNARESVFVAEIGKEVVGFVHVEIYNVIYCDTGANFLGLAVSLNNRRKGIGKALVKEAQTWAGKNGAKWLRLNSGMKRKDAHEFYRRLGFDNEKLQIRFIKSI